MNDCSITFNFATAAAAAAFLASLGPQAQAYTPPPGPVPAPQAYAPPPVPVPAPQAYAPPPVPVPAPQAYAPPPAQQHTMATVAPLMQAYADHFKPNSVPAIQAVFTKIGAPMSLAGCTAEQLNLLAQYFQSMQPA